MPLINYSVTYRGVTYSRCTSRPLRYAILTLAEDGSMRPQAWVCTTDGVAHQLRLAGQEGRTIVAVALAEKRS